MVTKEPVTLSGWYEHTDGTVGEYRWAGGQVVLGRVAACWAEVPSTPSWDDTGYTATEVQS